MIRQERRPSRRRTRLEAPLARLAILGTSLMLAATAAPAHDDPKFNIALLEFFDPSSSNLAEPLTYLWYREIYQSVSDLHDAYVTRVVREPAVAGGANTLISTPVGSHDLATNVALAKHAQASVWGVLAGLDKTSIVLSASLTIPPAAKGASGLEDAQATPTRFKGWRNFAANQQTKSAGITAPEVDLTRVNFAPLATTLRALYGKEAKVRCAMDSGCPRGSITLYQTPDAGSKGTPLQEGETLALDLDTPDRRPVGKFVPVTRASDNNHGWVYAYYLDFQPEEIFVSGRNSVYGRNQPGSGGSTALNGPAFLRVLQSRSVGPVHAAARWYQVAVPGNAAVWVNRAEVRDVWPANHINFIAGLYRYALGKYSAAYDEFDVFTRRANPKEENVALSLAYQFMAASLLRGESGSIAKIRSAALELLDKAVALTPFDDRALYVRAYARFGWPLADSPSSTEFKAIKSDLAQAKALLKDVQVAGESRGDLQWFSFTTSTPNANADVFRATRNLPVCSTSLGTLAVEPSQGNSNISLSQTLPKQFIMALATHSNCFTVVKDEKDPHFSQVDYVLQPKLNVKTQPALGNLYDTPIEAAQISLALSYYHSAGQTVATSFGKAERDEFTWTPDSQDAAAPTTSVTEPWNREIVTSAYLDAYAKLVQTLKDAGQDVKSKKH